MIAMPDRASHVDPPRSTTPAWQTAIGLLAIAVVALYLRTLATDAPFTSADHVMIAYRTTCEPGWRWCFQNHYGPLQPLMTKVIAHAVTGLGIPMTESLWRLPMGIVGALIPLLAFPLARRVGASPVSAWYAAIWTAVLPPLVTDARYMWAYETLGTALALAVMIATFAYMERPTRGRAWIAGGLLAAYLLSHLHVYAVPCVVALILLFDRPAHSDDTAQSHCSQSSGTRSLLARLLQVLRTPGLWLPPLISLCVLISAWRKVGGGPIARIITKSSAAAASPDRLEAALSLARAWLGHIGWPVAALIVVMLALSAARSLMTRPAHSYRIPRRAWFLVLWIILFAAPLFILGFRTGRPTQYLTQATAIATILTAVVLFADPRTSIGPRYWRKAGGTLIAFTLLFGSLSANVLDKRPSQWLGITAAWGANGPNAGYKTAGWFVRELVSPDAVVFALHDTSGLERPVAEYYLGRQCIAAEDLSPEQSMALFNGLADDVDIIIDDLRVDSGRDRHWPEKFRPVARIRQGSADLIHILARDAAPQSPMLLQPVITDEIYDVDHGPRRLGITPPKSPRFPDAAKIRNLIRK